MPDSLAIRAFIGSSDFATSRRFYADLGCEEVVIDPTMSYFSFRENLGFYLQNYYSKEWVNNTMLFLEVNELEEWHQRIEALQLTSSYKQVKLSEIVQRDWGAEFFLHDPSGVLWHIGTFNPST